MNKTIILGTITKDIELRYTNTGTAIANFSIAHNKRWTDKNTNERKEKASFFDVQVFGKQAETINQYFRKGSRILIDGELDQQTWKAQDGTNRSKVVINLNGFDFIDKNERNNQPQQYQQPPAAYAQNGAPVYTEPAPQSRQPQQPNLPEVDIDEDEIPF